VLDAQLGGNNALRLVQKLRTQAETAQIPILWVTEYASDFVSLSHNQNYRIDGFINKPIDGNKLVAKVDSLLK
jgi:response regulator RpfG family c-di-GMP phosphodiesterase